MVLFVYNLPDEILKQIQTFSTCDDYHYFLNTSKQYFSRWKKQSIYFTLNSSRSVQYVNDLIFRQLLLNKVENGWKQISVIFRNEDGDTPPSQYLLSIPADIPIHRIRSPGRKGDLLWASQNSLNHAEIVECIEFSDVTIPPIPKVKELCLYDCNQLTDVSNLSHLEQLQILGSLQLEDLSPLRNIPKIEFSKLSKACDFSMFNCNNQSYLSIASCKQISNIENFEMIRKLNLIDCPTITDISCLYGIYDLTLWSLPKVKDISGLGGHHRINLRLGDKVAGYERLYNIPHVSLSANLTDISMLRNAKSVKLTEFKQLEDVSPLANAKEVWFNQCFNYCIKGVDIWSLRYVPILRIILSDNIYSREKMQNQFVDLCTDYADFDEIGGQLISNFRTFLKVPNLFLTLFPSSEEQLIASEYLLSFQNLQSLTLNGYGGEIDNFQALGDIPRVTLRMLVAATSIKCLGRKNRYVKLHMCYKVEDVSSLKNVPVVTIIRCPEIKNLEVLANVPRLKVSNPRK